MYDVGDGDDDEDHDDEIMFFCFRLPFHLILSIHVEPNKWQTRIGGEEGRSSLGN